MGVGVSGPAMEACPVQGRFPPGALSCQDGLLPLMTLNWNKQVGKLLSYLFLFFCKCKYNSHLFSLFIIRDDLGLYLEVWLCFCNRKAFKGT